MDKSEKPRILKEIAIGGIISGVMKTLRICKDNTEISIGAAAKKVKDATREGVYETLHEYISHATYDYSIKDKKRETRHKS